jgi:hypothetical protein
LHLLLIVRTKPDYFLCKLFEQPHFFSSMFRASVDMLAISRSSQSISYRTSGASRHVHVTFFSSHQTWGAHPGIDTDKGGQQRIFLRGRHL